MPGDIVSQSSSIISQQSIDDLIIGSDSIITGNIAKILPSKKGSPLPDIKPIIYTDVIVTVDKYLYGQSNSKEIAIRVETGRIDNQVTISEDEPVLTVDENVLLFLAHPNSKTIPPPDGFSSSDYYRIVGMLFGKYIVDNGMATATTDQALTSKISVVDLTAKISTIHTK